MPCSQTFQEPIMYLWHAGIQRGGQGVRTPPERPQKYRVLSNTGLDPLKNQKATKPAFNVGPSLARQQNAI